jgi:hypothetical protein
MESDLASVQGPRERLGTGAMCPEAQADGVPCEELGRECEECDRRDEEVSRLDGAAGR